MKPTSSKPNFTDTPLQRSPSPSIARETASNRLLRACSCPGRPRRPPQRPKPNRHRPGSRIAPPETPVSQTGLSIHPSIQPSNHPFPDPFAHRSRRNGKIARLPKQVRDVVNRMISMNIPQDRIVSALDDLGICVTQQNISNWKTRGGYLEWCLAQQYATQLRLHQDNLVDLLRGHDAPELPEIGLQATATQLSSFFLTAEARQLLASDAKEYERRVSMLNRISAQLKTLQQSRDEAAKALGRDHDPDRIRNETNSALERLTDSYTAEIGDSPKDPDIPRVSKCIQ